jgi:hypothetical protein
MKPGAYLQYLKKKKERIMRARNIHVGSAV